MKLTVFICNDHVHIQCIFKCLEKSHLYIQIDTMSVVICLD